MLSMKKQQWLLLAATACLAALAGLVWAPPCLHAQELPGSVLGQELPQARLLRSLRDGRCCALFFELPGAEAEALCQRLFEAHGRQRLEPDFAWGMGDEVLSGLSGYHCVLPFAGDGFCRYFARLDDGTLVAIRASYGG